MDSAERWSPKISPVARKADCDGRADLWTVRSRTGPDLTRIGWGDTGMFSPMGRRLAIDYGGDSCWGSSTTDPTPVPADPCRARTGQTVAESEAPTSSAGCQTRRLIVVARGDGSLVDATSGRLFMTGDGPNTSRLANASALSCSGRVAVARQNELDVFTRTAVQVGGTDTGTNRQTPRRDQPVCDATGVVTGWPLAVVRSRGDGRF